jgi:CBS domain-containing protein
MELSQIARRVVSIPPGATAREASKFMAAEEAGAMVVLDGDRLVGILSARDVVERVVARGRDPEKTLVSEIMTHDVRTITDGATSREAADLMQHKRFRHLPLLDAGGKVIGMLSMGYLLRDRVGELSLQNADLFGFISTDGPGG